MTSIIISENEAGQRLDKLLAKYMNLAPKSFLYKMMRKKNITLNGKRCEGSERLSAGDEVKLFLSDETIGKFTRPVTVAEENAASRRSAVMAGRGMDPAFRPADSILDIIYEDAHILLVNKPAGMLSQKAKESDVSLTEYIIAYLLDSGALTAESLRTFRPAVCSRLDRNTSGLVAAGKSLVGLQVLSRVFRDRSIHKEYRCVVKGRVGEKGRIAGFLTKDERTNKAAVHTEAISGSAAAETEYEPLSYLRDEKGREYTCLGVTLLTGRTHQIRAHLASIGHPVVGDVKYGDKLLNEELRTSAGIRRPMLHSYRITFPELPEPLSYLSGKTFTAPLPKDFEICGRFLDIGQTASIKCSRK